MRKWLKELREERGIKQNEIAAKIGVAQSYYSLIENGERKKDMPISMVKKLASVFQVPVEVILERESER